MAAVLANVQVLFQISVENHLAAGGTLVPKILRHLSLTANQFAKFRANKILEPIHGGVIISYLRAERTPWARSETKLKTFSGISAAPALAATISTNAEPTTAPSATRAISAA